MLRLLQNDLENQVIWAMLRKLTCIANQAVITHQLVIIARAVVRDCMW